MARPKKSAESTPKVLPPSRTSEARENQMINLAINLAEKKLRDGTASNQIIVHYLKLGTEKEKIEREILEKQKDLLVAKTEALQSEKRVEELYANALKAMSSYRGEDNEDLQSDE